MNLFATFRGRRRLTKVLSTLGDSSADVAISLLMHGYRARADAWQQPECPIETYLEQNGFDFAFTGQEYALVITGDKRIYARLPDAVADFIADYYADKYPELKEPRP